MRKKENPLKIVLVNLLVLVGLVTVTEVISTVVLKASGKSTQIAFNQIANIFFKQNVIPNERYLFDEFSLLKYKPHEPYDKLPVNNQGFVAPKDDFIATSDEYYDVFMFGGSTMAGALLETYDQTLNHFVENRLREKNFNQGRVRVFNAGIESHMTTHQFQKLISQVLVLFSPDLIVFYDGWNDSNYYNRTKLPAFDYAYFPFNAHPLYGKLKEVEGFGWSEVIRSTSTFKVMQSLKRKILNTTDHSKIVRSMELPPETRPLSHAELSAWTIRYAWIITKQLDIDFLHFTQPALGHKKHLSEKEERMALVAPIAREFEIYREFAIARMKHLRAFGVPSYDLSAVLSEIKEEVFFDSCHVNDKGNAVIGTHMADMIIGFLGNLSRKN